MEEIIAKVLGLIVSFAIGFIAVLVGFTIWNLFKRHFKKKRVLQAVTELGIEEELANSVAGCNARCNIFIKQYFVKHGWGMPFVGADGNMELCCILNELRTEGKLKPVYGNLMSMKKKSDGHKNAVMLRKAKNDVV